MVCWEKKYQAIFGKARIQKSFVKAVAIYTIFSLILLYITGKTHGNIIAHKYNWKQQSPFFSFSFLERERESWGLSYGHGHHKG